jgi:hypothetical protein
MFNILVKKEIQIKSTLRLHLIMSVIKEKQVLTSIWGRGGADGRLLHTVRGNVS